MTVEDRNRVIALNEKLSPPPFYSEGEISCPKCEGTDVNVLCGRAYCQNDVCLHFFDLGDRS